MELEIKRYCAGADSTMGNSISNTYLDKSGGKYAKAVVNPLNYGFVFVVSMVFGGLLASRRQKNMPAII